MIKDSHIDFAFAHAGKLSILAVAIIASCAAGTADAKCRANDSWSGPDKIQHAQAGALIGFVGTMNNGSQLEGIGWAALAAGGKELIDATGTGDCSAQDFAVTVAGGIIGSFVGKGVYLTFDPRAKSVQVGINLPLGN